MSSFAESVVEGTALVASDLEKLLQGEIEGRSKRNIVQARSFAEMQEEAVRKYRNRAIETAQFIEELIQLSRDTREGTGGGRP